MVRVLLNREAQTGKKVDIKTVNTDLLRFLQHKNIQVENLHHIAAAISVV